MSEMTSHESFERLWEGLTRAASCCRELGKMTTINSWFDLSRQLLITRQKAKVLYESAPLSEVQVNALVTNMEIAQLSVERLRQMQGF